MHMKKLAVAISLACGSLAAVNAHAYDVDLFLSGASAVQGSFVSQLDNYFVAGYTTACDNLSTACAGYFSVKGTLKSAAPVPATLQGKTARITYRTRGGSVWGVNPLATADKIEWMDMDAPGACGPTPAGTTFNPSMVCSPAGSDTGAANTYGPARISDLGVSDVEPKLFFGVNLEFDNATRAPRPALSSTDLAGLTSQGVFQNAFSMPMTNVIPTSMFVDKESLTGMLSAATAQFHDWSGIAGAPLTAINPGVTSNPTANNKPVVVCRRVQGSGTQATTNFFANGFGCTGGAYSTPSRMTDSAGFDATGIYDFTAAHAVTSTPSNRIIIDPSYGYTVVENPGSGDVRSCLTAAQNGTNYLFKGDDNNYYEVTFSGSATAGTTAASYTNGNTLVNAPFGAVGVLSYDSQGKENGWHFHDLDGILTPNVAAIDASGRPYTGTAKYAEAAMIEGAWDFFSEESMQYRNGSNGKPALTDAALGALTNSNSISTGPVKTLALSLITAFGNPAYLNANNGVAALPSLYTPTGDVTTNKVAKGTKNGDTCKPKVPQYKKNFWGN